MKEIVPGAPQYKKQFIIYFLSLIANYESIYMY